MKPVMNEADLYRKHNSLQKRDAIKCLQEYALNIKWAYKGDRVMDIGCGDGSVTSNVLRLYLPKNFEKLVGCDISDKMVAYAREHHKDDRTHFQVMDIEDTLPIAMRESFDHVFSFYTLHWVQNQQKAFTNIYDLLVPGGDCLLLFLGHMPVYDVYRVLSQNPRWAQWVYDVESYVSPYHDSQDPETEIHTMMKNIGFRDISVNCKEKVIIYDNLELMKNSVLAINPFQIPKELHDEFMKDYVDVVRDLGIMRVVDNDISVTAHYTVMIAYGSK